MQWRPEQVHDALVTVDEETDRLNRLVGDLLDASRLQIGALAVNCQTIDVAESIGVTLADIGVASKRVEVEVPPGLPPVVGDSTLFERSLDNIVANALRYGGASPVRLTVGVVGDEIHVCVIDRGPGIPGHQREMVLAPFQQLGDARAAGGVGLGMSIALGFIRAMHGTLEFDDTPGGGLTVIIALPIAASKRAVVTRILVVDDEPQIRRALSLHLGARGYEIFEADTGERAIQVAATEHPDVVLLDLGLPGMDGVLVIQALRGWTEMPIIVLSVRDDERAKVQALDAGADDYVTKPFGMAELLARVRAVLRRPAGAQESKPEVCTSSFRLDLNAHRAFVTDVAGDEEVRLTPTEWAMVEYLVRYPGRLVTYRQLITAVWGPTYDPDPNLLRVHMAHIRRKLEVDGARPKHFITDSGMGYRFDDET